MEEGLQTDRLEETLKLLVQIAAAQEQHLAEQERIHQQHLEVERRKFDLAEKSSLLYEKAIEQHETDRQRSEKRYQEHRAEQKRQQRGAWVVLLVIVICLLLAIVLSRLGNKTKGRGSLPSQNRVLGANQEAAAV